MAATFGAPLAAVVLAIELLLFEFSTRRSSRWSSRRASPAACTSRCFGTGPLFPVPPHDFAGLGQLPCSPCSASRAVCSRSSITKGLFAVEAGSAACRSASSGTRSSARSASASSGSLVPRALGVGYDRSATCSPTGSRSGRSPRCSSPSSWRGGSRWRRARRAARSRRSCSSAARSARCSGRCWQRRHPRPRRLPGAFALVAMAATFGASTRATVHGDRVRVRADPRLPRDPAAHARHGARRPRRPRVARATGS